MTYCTDLKGGNVSTVLWYRGEHPEPIYTYDARYDIRYNIYDVLYTNGKQFGIFRNNFSSIGSIVISYQNLSPSPNLA